MKCPVDGATLSMTERSGIEIDYCPECRGVWLDRGELDKIVQRANSEEPARYDEEPARRSDEREHGDEHGRREQDRYERKYDDKKKRRGSFMGDLFGGFGDD